MKSNLIHALALLLLAVPAFAEMKSDDGVPATGAVLGDDYYVQVGKLFQEGVLPDAGKLVGTVRSGRCFLPEQPSTPINGAYLIRETTMDAGPLATGTRFFQAASLWQKSKPADHYDHLSLAQINAEAPVRYTDLAVFGKSLRFVMSGGDTSNLRANGKYLIEELQTSDGTAYARCYYFLPEYSAN